MRWIVPISNVRGKPLRRGKIPYRSDFAQPLHDIALLEERTNIRYVMKGGEFFRRPAATVVRPAAEPAPAPAYA